MIKAMDRRLLVPATMAIGGSAIAIATWIGQGFGNALGIEIVTVVATIGYFVLGGRDSDFGAIFGSRPDERQANIDLRATAFTGLPTTARPECRARTEESHESSTQNLVMQPLLDPFVVG